MDRSAMHPDMLLLAKLLSLAALVGATVEYAEVMKRRVIRRAAARDRAIFEDDGLHGLVRVFLADARPPEVPFADPQRG